MKHGLPKPAAFPPALRRRTSRRVTSVPQHKGGEAHERNVKQKKMVRTRSGHGGRRVPLTKSGPPRYLGGGKPPSPQAHAAATADAFDYSALPLRYSRVSLYAVRNSSHLWTRGLCSATLAKLSSALWSENIRKVVPHKYPWRRLILQTMLPASRSSGVQCRSDSTVARLMKTIGRAYRATLLFLPNCGSKTIDTIVAVEEERAGDANDRVPVWVDQNRRRR